MIILTGGAGFIGSAFLKKLNVEGVTDIVVVDHLGTSEKWKNLVGKTYSDFFDKEEFISAVEAGESFGKIDAIVHLGACSSTTERDASYMVTNNYSYSVSLALWAKEQNARFIYASSGATYGDGSLGFSDDHQQIPTLRPLNVYGYSKQMFDLWMLRQATHNKYDNFAGIKFFNVFGPNEYHKGAMSSVVYKAFHEIQQNGEMRLFKSDRSDYADGAQLRDFIYVKDCVNTLWTLLNKPQTNGIFNLGSGKARTWNDLAHAIFSALGKNPKISYIDMPAELKGKYQYFTEAKMDKLRSSINVEFLSLEEGVKDYICNHLSSPYSYW